MEDQINQGMPGGMPASPIGGPASPLGGPVAEEGPQEKIMAALARIEERLAVIAAKVGA